MFKNSLFYHNRVWYALLKVWIFEVINIRLKKLPDGKILKFSERRNKADFVWEKCKIT
jgi:hypothetical protein